MTTRMLVTGIFAAVGLMANLGQADTIVLQGPAVTDDATVNSFFNDRIYQTAGPTNLELQSPNVNSRGWAVVKFNLPTLAPGQSITDATMTFDYFGNYNTNSGSINVNLHRLLYSWVESEVSWDQRSAGVRWEAGANGNVGYADGVNPPANYDAASLGSITLTYNQYGLKTYQSAALTSVLNQMAQGTLPNNGFVLNAGTSGGGSNRFLLVSSDRPGDVFHPRLELTVVPEPATLALAGLGLCAAASRRRRD